MIRMMKNLTMKNLTMKIDLCFCSLNKYPCAISGQFLKWRKGYVCAEAV